MFDRTKRQTEHKTLVSICVQTSKVRRSPRNVLKLLRTSLPTRSFLPTATSPSAVSADSLRDSMTAFFLLSTRPCEKTNP